MKETIQFNFNFYGTNFEVVFKKHEIKNKLFYLKERSEKWGLPYDVRKYIRFLIANDLHEQTKKVDH